MGNPKRDRIQEIRKLNPDEIAGVAWISVVRAAIKTGASVYAIRHAGLELKRIGNADFVDPEKLNRWIEEPGQSPSLDL